MALLSCFISQTSGHAMVKFITAVAHNSQGGESRHGPGIQTPEMCPAGKEMGGGPRLSFVMKRWARVEKNITIIFVDEDTPLLFEAILEIGSERF